MRRSALLLSTLVASAMVGAPAAQADITIGFIADLSGAGSWAGAGLEAGVELGVAGLNAAGGLLGQQVNFIKVDDHCDGAQAVAAANKLVAEGVDFVVGHNCSDAAVPASRVYAEADILMMTPRATNPLLTEQGFTNIFRICGRDDLQGAMAGAYLAEHWKDKKIVILHDGGVYGQGLAEETRKVLNARGVAEALFAEIERDLLDYTDVIDRMQALDADVLYYSGMPNAIALMMREIRERGDDLQLVSGDSVGPEAYGLVALEAGDGTLFTNMPVARVDPQVATLAKLDPLSSSAYAAIQAWAQAVEQAGRTDADAVGEVLRTGSFDTVLGRVEFDDKGDVAGYEPFAWFVWQDGKIVPANLTD